MEHALARYRRLAGLSREDIAKLAGTTRQTIHRIEAGMQSPSLDLVGRLIAATGGKAVTATDFLPAPVAAAHAPANSVEAA